MPSRREEFLGGEDEDIELFFYEVQLDNDEEDEECQSCGQLLNSDYIVYEGYYCPDCRGVGSFSLEEEVKEDEEDDYE